MEEEFAYSNKHTLGYGTCNVKLVMAVTGCERDLQHVRGQWLWSRAGVLSGVSARGALIESTSERSSDSDLDFMPR